MTRETKIGLLVGLGFIILFGLILGERTNMPTRPSGSEVGEGIVAGPANPTQIAQLSAREAASVITPAVTPAPTPQTQAAAPVVDQGPVKVASTAGNSDAAAAAGSGVVLPKTPSADAVRLSMGDTVTNVASLPPADQTYVVVAKDTPISIAKKVYGPTHVNEYKRILEANALKDGTGLKVGQKLRIPSLPGEVTLKVAAAPAGKPAAAKDADSVQLPSTDTPKAVAGKTYKIQQGDTLYSIAHKTLKDGSPAAQKKILEANKTKISSPTQLRIGAELVIPT